MIRFINQGIISTILLRLCFSQEFLFWAWENNKNCTPELQYKSKTSFENPIYNSKKIDNYIHDIAKAMRSFRVVQNFKIVKTRGNNFPPYSLSLPMKSMPAILASNVRHIQSLTLVQCNGKTSTITQSSNKATMKSIRRLPCILQHLAYVIVWNPFVL